jgi:nucleotide-binding universal stress UspA family protein
MVCGIDGSPEARSALRVAMQLGDALSLRVVALHVAQAFGDDPKLVDRLRARGNAERLLANVLYDEQLLGRVDWRAEIGDVAAQLAAVAAEEQALLILLGARSNGKARPFLGSRLAEEMVATSSIPVVVVPPQVAPAQAHMRSPGNLARQAKAPVPARPAASNRAPLAPSRRPASRSGKRWLLRITNKSCGRKRPDAATPTTSSFGDATSSFDPAFPPSLAARAAKDGGYDLHAFVELLGRGCPPELAIRILAPLESDMPATAFDAAGIRPGRELR